MLPYEFTSSALGWSIMLCVVIGLVAFYFAEPIYSEFRQALDSKVKASYLRKARRTLAITIVLGFILGNGVTFWAAHGHSTTLPVTSSRDVAESFGLKSDEPYPLVLGDRIEGSVGSVTASANHGFFKSRAYASATLRPGSAISVSFVHQRNSYVLEIPVSISTFTQQEGVAPTVSLHLNDMENSSYGVGEIDDSRPCKPVIETVLLMCHRSITRTYPINELTAQRGLAVLLSDSDVLDSAHITLTPEMYDQIVVDGKNK